MTDFANAPVARLERGPVVVAGGLNMDALSRPHAPLQPGTSNPAQTRFAPGGVGRNLAQNLAQLGVPVRLLGAVGEDAFGDTLLHLSRAEGIDVSGVLRLPGDTGSYLAVLSERGELVYGLSSMALIAGLTPEVALHWPAALDDASVLIVDANLSPALIAFLLDAAQTRGVPAVLEPVSAPKAQAVRPLLSPSRPLWLLSPDRAELSALADVPLDSAPEAALIQAAQHVCSLGAEYVLLTLGRRGSLLVGEGTVLHTPAFQAQVQDVTGAGDALLAGVVAGLWHGHDWPAALAQAHLCAALTIEVPGAVRSDLSPALLAAERRPMLAHPAETLP